MKKNYQNSHLMNYQMEKEMMKMKSDLVTYTKLSPNNSGKRKYAVTRITPHCVVGQASVETLGNIFAKTSRQASSNYGIGADGRVGMYVEEQNRSWCSSNADNDNRAITIECASDATAPYAFNDTVYNRLIELCTDICKRYGKTKLLWLGDKDKTLAYTPKDDEMILTVHRWFANKSCPGAWLMARMSELANSVTNALQAETTTQEVVEFTPYRVKITASVLNIRKGPGTDYSKVGSIADKGIYTIIEESNGKGASSWGKLKSGKGWISLDWTSKR